MPRQPRLKEITNLTVASKEPCAKGTCYYNSDRVLIGVYVPCPTGGGNGNTFWLDGQAEWNTYVVDRKTLMEIRSQIS